MPPAAHARQADLPNVGEGGKAAVGPIAQVSKIGRMAKTNEHGRIIAAAAKSALAPLGFHRKGASRVWLADHGFWLDVVEFQPSGFSKGSYCNVSVHWLWGMTPALTFDYGFRRVGSFAQFNSTDAFSQSVAEMARAAVGFVERHRAVFVSLPVTAAHLSGRDLTDGGPGGWDAFHAGVACGLARDDSTARRMFDRVGESDSRNLDWVNERREKVERLAAVLGDHAAFRHEVQALLDAQRALFKLVPFTLPEPSDTPQARGS